MHCLYEQRSKPIPRLGEGAAALHAYLACLDGTETPWINDATSAIKFFTPHSHVVVWHHNHTMARESDEKNLPTHTLIYRVLHKWRHTWLRLLVHEASVAKSVLSMKWWLPLTRRTELVLWYHYVPTALVTSLNTVILPESPTVTICGSLG